MATPMMPRPRKPILSSAFLVAAAMTVAALLGLPRFKTGECTTDRDLSAISLLLAV